MVKINLLDLPEKPQTGKSQNAEDTARDSNASSKKEMEFDFFTDDDDRSTNAPDPKPTVADQTRDDKPSDYGTRPTFTDSIDEDEPPSFDDISPKSRFLKYGLFALALLFVAVIIYFLIPGGSEPTPPTPVVDDPSGTMPERPAIPETMQRLYSENQAANNARLGYAGSLLSTQAPGAASSLVIITPGHAYFSVLGDSREAIAKFRMNVQNNNPQAGAIEAESVEEQFVNGQKKLRADFSMVLPTRSSGQAGGQFSSVQAGQSVKNALQSMAQRNNLRYAFTDGQRENTRGMVRNFFYVRISGTRGDVINYLTELTDSQPAASIEKISLYPANASTFASGNTEAHIELSIFSQN